MERTASPQAVPPAGGSGLCLLGSRARLVSRRIWTQRGQRSSRRETRSVRSPGREREKVDSARLPLDRASPCRAPHAPCMRGPRAVPPPHLAPLPPAPAGSAGSIRAGGAGKSAPSLARGSAPLPDRTAGRGPGARGRRTLPGWGVSAGLPGSYKLPGAGGAEAGNSGPQSAASTGPEGAEQGAEAVRAWPRPVPRWAVIGSPSWAHKDASERRRRGTSQAVGQGLGPA